MLNDEYELLFLHIRLMGKVIVIFLHFLFSTYVYSVSKVHNMITLMFDPHFKILDNVKVLVGRPKLATMVFEYDKTLLPVLIIAFHFLNPRSTLFIDAKFSSFDLEDFIFGHVVSNVNNL
jgi:hypothetical protein